MISRIEVEQQDDDAIGRKEVEQQDVDALSIETLLISLTTLGNQQMSIAHCLGKISLSKHDSRANASTDNSMGA